MRIRTRTTVATGAALILGLAPATAIAAEVEPHGSGADEIASLVAEAAPDHLSTVQPAVESRAATVQTSAGHVAAPLDASQPIEIVGRDKESLSVRLPIELDLAAGQVTADGTIVYADDDGAAAAVQILEDDRVRVQTTIPDAQASTTFTYTWDDSTTPVLNEDGSVDLVEEQAQGVSTTVGHVAAPWAVDANGADVPSEYVVEGDALVQVVYTDADTAYPVVADPTFGHTYGVPTMYLNWAETQSARDAGYAGWLCGLAPVPMNLICAGNIANITSAANRAVDAGKCVKYLIGPLVVAGLHYSC